MRHLHLVLILFISTLSVQAGIKDILNPEKLAGKVREEIAEMDISASVKLVDLDLAEGIGISSKYKYEVEPSYQAKHYTRIDRWKLNTDIKAGDIIKDIVELPVYLNIAKGAEVNFVRQFPSKKEAMLKKPYFLSSLPVNADKALKLHVGDFVSIPTTMSVAVGAGIGNAYEILKTNVGAYVVFSGQFLVHVYRMKDSKVRVRLIAQRNSSYGANSSAKLSFDIFGISVVDRQIKRWVDLDVAKFGGSHGSGHQLIIDYIFDLKTEEAKHAYNSILGSTFKFKDVDMFKEYIKERGLEDRLISVYEDAEVLFKEDVNKKAKRVDRIFKGFNDFKKESSHFKLGLLVTSYSKNKTFIENKISYDDKHGQRKRFYYPTQTDYKKNEFDIFILKAKERVVKTTFGLVPLDDEDYGDSYTDFGFTYDRKDKVFRIDEQRKYIQMLNDTLPDELYDSIDWKGWDEYRSRPNTVASMQVIFKKEALAFLKGMQEKDIRKKLYTFYKERKLVDISLVDGFFKRLWRKLRLINGEERSDIKYISQKLYAVFNSNEFDGKDRIKTLMDLRDRYIFKRMGFKFLMSLVPANELDKYVYINLRMHSKKDEEVKFVFGTQGYSEVYHELMYVNSVLNDRSIDLRLTERELKFKEEGQL
ncbi:hypothetical protein [Bacteriovorax sp. DB6_IX]|uniref:hypothetical protein n=1 Tax=Bacteriovorax sp. DB6_IX TaxID=1353530 RepID=UPI000389DF1C|nr:hypothetical protein [Bacteriovorax sp. DB6_IX]EQC52322.1 hypothetical protein M901_2523 [Bacteriovorax sp. DB6_IX]